MHWFQIQEKGFESLNGPGSTAMNGYHNLSFSGENTPRQSTLSAVSNNNPALYESAL